MILVVFFLCALGFVLIWRVPACPRAMPRCAADQTVSIIVPARDESHNLPRMLESIAAQEMPPLEVIVMDDDSSDGTAHVARAHGATVYTVPPLPPGWRGKTWACWNGAQHARGDVMLFLDADTWFAQADALARIETACRNAGCRALSLAPYHVTRRFYEQFSAVFNLLTAAGIDCFSLYGSPDRPHGLFGPMLWIERAAYESCGGHRAVRAEILENMSLAPVLRQRGIPMACRGGRGVLHVRMYPRGWRSLVDGWTKAFAAGAGKTSPRALLVSIAWLTGGMLALLTAVHPPNPWWMAVLPYAAYVLVFHRMLRPLGAFAPWVPILYPIPFVGFFLIFTRSLILQKSRGAVSWKGRAIPPGESP